jgi:predicted nucleic acid-binding protein
VIVVDASALLEVLMRTPLGTTVEARLLSRVQTLHAPHLLDAEVAQVVRRFALAGEIDGERAEEALDDFKAFPSGGIRTGFSCLGCWPCETTSALTTRCMSRWPRCSTHLC